jgi:hypothetical protein
MYHDIMIQKLSTWVGRINGYDHSCQYWTSFYCYVPTCSISVVVLIIAKKFCSNNFIMYVHVNICILIPKKLDSLFSSLHKNSYALHYPAIHVFSVMYRRVPTTQIEVTFIVNYKYGSFFGILWTNDSFKWINKLILCQTSKSKTMSVMHI